MQSFKSIQSKWTQLKRKECVTMCKTSGLLLHSHDGVHGVCLSSLCVAALQGLPRGANDSE